MNKKIKLLFISTLIINSMFFRCCYANDNKIYSTNEVKPIDLHLDTKPNNTEKKVEQKNNKQDNKKQNTNKDMSFIIDTSKIPKGTYTIQGITEIDSSNKITYKESVDIKSNNFEITSTKLLGIKDTKPNKIYNVNMQLLNKENKVVLNKNVKCQRQKSKEDVDRDKCVDNFTEVFCNIFVTIIILCMVGFCLFLLYLYFFGANL